MPGMAPFKDTQGYTLSREKYVLRHIPRSETDRLLMRSYVKGKGYWDITYPLHMHEWTYKNHFIES